MERWEKHGVRILSPAAAPPTGQELRASLRRAGCVGVLLGVLGAFAGGWLMPASAKAPNAQGWWSVGGELGATVLGADVPSDGLLVQGGPTSPSAYAALRFSLPPGTIPGELRLEVESVESPGTELRVCRLTDEFTPVQGGDIEDAPSYDCADDVTAAIDGGDGLTLDASSLARGRELAVALLPSREPDRVVFGEPDADSLDVASVTTTSGFDPNGSSRESSRGDDDASSRVSRSVGTIEERPVSPVPGEQSAAEAGPNSEHDVGVVRPSAGSGSMGTLDRGDLGDSGVSLRLALLAVGAPLIGGGLWLGAGAAAVRRVQEEAQ